MKRAGENGLYPGMHHPKLLLAGALGASLLSSIAHATPPTCERWSNSLTECEALDKKNGCTLFGWQKDQANHEIYASSAKQVCANYMKHLHPDVGAAWEMWPVDANPEGTVVDGPYEQARCVWDVEPDGDIDWNDATATGVFVSFGNVTPDPHCFCTANNPAYAGLEWNHQMTTWQAVLAAFAHVFPPELKKAILAKNVADNSGKLMSDAPQEAGVELQKTDPYAADAAEIDHIIPRVDSKGCVCGDVTPNNAAVISRGLNNSMSNTSPKWNADRAKMYAKYVTCPDPKDAKYAGLRYAAPLLAIPIEFQDLDEPTLDVDPPRELIAREVDNTTTSGGCSTTGGAGPLALGLLLVLRRRGASRRSR